MAGALDRDPQRCGVAGLGQELMRDGNYPQRGGKFRVSREHDAHHLGILVAHVGKQLGSVHSRHSHVGDNDIEGRGLHQRQGSFAAGRESHLPLMALGTQHAPQPLQYPEFVVYKKHAPHGTFVSLGTFPAVDRQAQVEGRSLTHFALKSQGTFVALRHHRPRNRQALSRSPSHFFGGKKGSKTLLRMPSGMPHPVFVRLIRQEVNQGFSNANPPAANHLLG